MKLTTHILDTATGRPAAGVPIRLYSAGRATSTAAAGGSPSEREAAEADGAAAPAPAVIASGTTDEDGRLVVADGLGDGVYQLRFETGSYHAAGNTAASRNPIYPWVDITVELRAEGGEHWHIPLLLSPFGFTTYRGS